MIEREDHDGIAVLRLAHGKASAMDLELLRAIATRMIALEEDESARGVVLTGTGSIFSAGVDLKRLVDGGEAYLSDFLPALGDAFRELFFFSKPLVGACNGHAIAGGCVMLACCDLRLVARGSARIGAPELVVGVPFPRIAVEILRAAVPAHHLQPVLLTGATYGVDEALARGLCDELVEPEDLVPRAIALARELARAPAASYRETKRLLRKPYCDRLRVDAERDDAETLRIWSSDEVRAAVAAYVRRTLAR